MGFRTGRASPSGGVTAALESCLVGPAKAAAVAGASGAGATSASAVRGGSDAPGSTNQRASDSDPIVGLNGTSSSIATGTSGSAGFALAASMGFGDSTSVAEPVVSAAAVGPNESAVNESVTPSANNNANASQMTVCFIAASPKPIE